MEINEIIFCLNEFFVLLHLMVEFIVQFGVFLLQFALFFRNLLQFLLNKGVFLGLLGESRLSDFEFVPNFHKFLLFTLEHSFFLQKVLDLCLKVLDLVFFIKKQLVFFFQNSFVCLDKGLLGFFKGKLSQFERFFLF